MRDDPVQSPPANQFSLWTLLGLMATAAVTLWVWSFGPLGVGVLVALVMTLLTWSADVESRRGLWPIVVGIWCLALLFVLAGATAAGPSVPH